MGQEIETKVDLLVSKVEVKRDVSWPQAWKTTTQEGSEEIVHVDSTSTQSVQNQHNLWITSLREPVQRKTLTFFAKRGRGLGLALTLSAFLLP